MKQWLKKITYVLLALILLSIGLLSFLITTSPGMYTVMKLSQLRLPGHIAIKQVKGRLLDEFSIGQLNYQYQGMNIQINRLQVKWTLKSLLHPWLTIEKLQAKSIDLRMNQTNIRIHSPQLTGLLSPQQIVIQQFQGDCLDKTIRLHLQSMLKPSLSISGLLQIIPQKKGHGFEGNLRLSGDSQAVHWSGKFLGPGDLSIQGHLKQSQLDQIIRWHDLHPLLNSPEGSLKTVGNWSNLKFLLSTQINTNPEENWQINANIEGHFPMQWQVNARAKPSQGKPQTLHTQLAVKGFIQDSSHGKLELIVQAGYYPLPQSTLPFKGGKVQVFLKPTGLFSTGSLELNQNVRIDSEWKLPHFDLFKGLKNQALSGQLTLLVPSLSFLQHIHPEISQVQGQLKASIKAMGTIHKPTFESQIQLSQTSVSLAHMGLDLKDIHLLLEGKNHRWQANAEVHSENKILTIKGQGLFNQAIQGNVALQATDFPIINTPEYQVKASPQLNLKLNGSMLTVSGVVLIPFARIKPQSLTNSLVLSDDVIYKKHVKPTPKWFTSQMNLQLSMGQDVDISIKGLHATLDGSIQIKQALEGPINANGLLSVKTGEYKAFGQVLEIEQGQLIYTDNALNHPGINLRAAKTIKSEDLTPTKADQPLDLKSNRVQNLKLDPNTKVGVEVSGPLNSPKIVLFSNPTNLSQADILSMILLDRPANLAHEAASQLLIAALSSMNLGTTSNGAELVAQLKQSLGFDIDVQNNPNLSQSNNSLRDSTTVVVGKSLSKKLYLSYNMGLSQANPNVLTLKYLLNQFFSIQMSNSSTGSSGMDVLFNGTKESIHE